MKNVLNKLPITLAEKIKNINNICEINLRCNRDVVIKRNIEYEIINYKLSQNDLNDIIKRFCDMSVYAYMDELKKGFITIHGGHRVGISGTAVIKDNLVYNIKDINSINIRIAHEVKNCTVKLGDFTQSILIVGPPGSGKTTYLRDICRVLSNNHKVSVVDERGEIAGVSKGIPTFDLGLMSDVLSMCDKRVGIELMLRSMSPEYIITDEIADSDVKSLNKALTYGVKIIASAHGDDISKTVLRLNLDDKHIFDKIILLSNKNGVGTVEKIVDGGCFCD